MHGIAGLGGIAEASAPRQQVALRPTRFENLRLDTHNMPGFLECEALENAEPCLGVFEGQRLGRIARATPRIDRKERLVGALDQVAAWAQEPKWHAMALGSIRVDQVQRISKCVVVLLELPAGHHGPAVGEFDAVILVLDHDPLLGSGFEVGVLGHLGGSFERLLRLVLVTLDGGRTDGFRRLVRQRSLRGLRARDQVDVQAHHDSRKDRRHEHSALDELFVVHGPNGPLAGFSPGLNRFRPTRRDGSAAAAWRPAGCPVRSRDARWPLRRKPSRWGGTCRLAAPAEKSRSCRAAVLPRLWLAGHWTGAGAVVQRILRAAFDSIRTISFSTSRACALASP